MKYIFGFFTVIGLLIGIWLMELYSQVRFDIDPIINYNPKKTTQLFDRNGDLVANIFDDTHRLYVPYDEIPSRVIEALIAIEDTQFFEHNGINVDAIGRAIIKDIKAGALVEGASTLTQQLVKTMALSREKKLVRKIKEAMLSMKLESVLTKEQILERYLNQVYFGHRYYGIKTASLGYFRKELNQLNIKEIAILVGLPKAPSFYDPTKNLEHSLSRANQVVRRLKTLGWINSVEYKHAIDYIPTIYDDTLSLNKAPYVVDEVIRQFSNQFPDIKTAGYKIHLTIDLNAQELARQALKFGYDEIKKRDQLVDTEESWSSELNGALISMENDSGRVIAMIGGIDYTQSSFNRVTQTKRQPGSAVKPFLYQIGLNLGYSPQSNLLDITRTYEYTDHNNEEQKWQPKNYSRNIGGLIRFKDALVKSKNLATINLVNDIGVDVVYNKLVSFGFEGISRDLSITLGSFSISPWDMSSMYSILSNKGKKVTPHIVESITDQSGKTIHYEYEPVEVLDPAQVYLMTDILSEVVTRGTGRRANVEEIQVAGKTGTTNDYVDAWFCGFTPTLQTIIWFGNDNNTPMNKTETGGSSAAPVFSHFVSNYLKLHPELQREFDKPEEGVYESNYKGQMELWTKTSPLPEVNEVIEQLEDENQIVF